MRVAIVADGADPAPPLGADDWRVQDGEVWEWASHLARAGASVELSVGRHPRSLREGTSADGVEVHRLPPPLPRTQSWDAATQPLSDALAERWRTDPPDVVQTWGYLAAAAGMRAAGRSPLVHAFSELSSLRRGHRMVEGSDPAELVFEQRVAQHAARSVVHCGAVLAKLRTLGAPRARIAHLPVGVDTDRFTRGASGEPPSRRAPRVLTIGAPGDVHDLEGVVTALADVPGAELVIAGGPSGEALDDDEQIAALRVHATRAGVSERVRFVGRVARDEAPDLIRSADLVVAYPRVPSHAAAVAGAQALACGVPVVAADLGGLAHLAGRRKPAPLVAVPPRDPAALARCLRTLLAEPHRRREMARVAPSAQRGWADWPTVAAHARSIYDAVVDAGARAPVAVSAAERMSLDPA